VLHSISQRKRKFSYGTAAFHIRSSPQAARLTTVLGYSLVSLFLYLLGALTVDFYVQICYSLRALMFVSKLYFKAKNQGRQHFCAICLDFYFEKDSWISLLEAIRKRKFHLQNRISFDISRSELLGLRPENLHGIKALDIVQDTMEQKSTENNLIGIVSDGLKNSFAWCGSDLLDARYVKLRHSQIIFIYL